MTGAKQKRIRRRDAGISLLEVNVAIIVLVIAVLTMGGHQRIYNQLLAGVTVDKKVDGYFDLTTERAVLTMAEADQDVAAPACDVTVQSVDTGGPHPKVFARVEQSGF